MHICHQNGNITFAAGEKLILFHIHLQDSGLIIWETK